MANTTASTTAKIRKFTKKQIVGHWMYAISFLTLVATGAAFLWRPSPQAGTVLLGPLLGGTVGQSMRLIHRLAAIVLMSAPLYYVASEPKRFLRDVKELLTFTQHDLKWMMIAPLHYTIGKPALPPQRVYNVGQKLNYWIVFLGYLAFSVTGIILWLGRDWVDKSGFDLAKVVHAGSFYVGFTMACLHIYLSYLHPFASKSFEAMKSGFLPLDYAKAEHPLWVDEEIKNGTAEIVDDKASGGATNEASQRR